MCDALCCALFFLLLCDLLDNTSESGNGSLHASQQSAEQLGSEQRTLSADADDHDIFRFHGHTGYRHSVICMPYRLEYYAKLYGYEYSKCRLTHANTRWGSCSSNRTISLNIGLMKVPEVLRDYVILHELAHLNHMDHSKAFWAEVGKHDKNYKVHEKKLKMFSPGV